MALTAFSGCNFSSQREWRWGVEGQGQNVKRVSEGIESGGDQRAKWSTAKKVNIEAVRREGKKDSFL